MRKRETLEWLNKSVASTWNEAKYIDEICQYFFITLYVSAISLSSNAVSVIL